MSQSKYSDADLINDALKYQSKGEWQKKSKNMYLTAYARGALELCCKHMVSLVEEKWTLDICKAKAKQYLTGPNWKKNCPNSYSKASRKHWLPLCLNPENGKINQANDQP